MRARAACSAIERSRQAASSSPAARPSAARSRCSRTHRSGWRPALRSRSSSSSIRSTSARWRAVCVDRVLEHTTLVPLTPATRSRLPLESGDTLLLLTDATFVFHTFPLKPQRLSRGHTVECVQRGAPIRDRHIQLVAIESADLVAHPVKCLIEHHTALLPKNCPYPRGKRVWLPTFDSPLLELPLHSPDQSRDVIVNPSG